MEYYIEGIYETGILPKELAEQCVSAINRLKNTEFIAKNVKFNKLIAARAKLEYRKYIVGYNPQTMPITTNDGSKVDIVVDTAFYTGEYISCGTEMSNLDECNDYFNMNLYDVVEAVCISWTIVTNKYTQLSKSDKEILIKLFDAVSPAKSVGSEFIENNNTSTDEAEMIIEDDSTEETNNETPIEVVKQELNKILIPYNIKYAEAFGQSNAAHVFDHLSSSYAHKVYYYPNVNNQGDLVCVIAYLTHTAIADLIKCANQLQEMQGSIHSSYFSHAVTVINQLLAENTQQYYDDIMKGLDQLEHKGSEFANMVYRSTYTICLGGKGTTMCSVLIAIKPYMDSTEINMNINNKKFSNLVDNDMPSVITYIKDVLNQIYNDFGNTQQHNEQQFIQSIIDIL